MMRARSQPGFTLVELMVALALFAIIASILFGSLRLAGRSADAGEEKAQASSGMRLASDYLREQLTSQHPQRMRKMLEYYHADRLNYAVAGTPNRLEYDQGFFVKLGDGAADIKPIAHLYKSQVYQMARFLGLPDEICSRQPTTDTYSLPQSQEEFYFSLPYDRMDLALYALNHGFTIEETGAALGLEPEQIQRVFRDIESKRRMAAYLHSEPVLIQPLNG